MVTRQQRFIVSLEDTPCFIVHLAYRISELMILSHSCSVHLNVHLTCEVKSQTSRCFFSIPASETLHKVNRCQTANPTNGILS